MSKTHVPIVRLAASVAILALVSASCGGGLSSGPTPLSTPSTSAGATPHITVTLGIYSGRADRSWDLGDNQTAELVARIEALPAATGTPPQGGLGYHGFVVMLQRPGQAYQTLVAYQATVAEPGTGPRPYRLDPAGRSSGFCWTPARPTLPLGRSASWRRTSQRSDPSRASPC